MSVARQRSRRCSRRIATTWDFTSVWSTTVASMMWGSGEVRCARPGVAVRLRRSRISDSRSARSARRALNAAATSGVIQPPNCATERTPSSTSNAYTARRCTNASGGGATAGASCIAPRSRSNAEDRGRAEGGTPARSSAFGTARRWCRCAPARELWDAARMARRCSGEGAEAGMTVLSNGSARRSLCDSPLLHCRIRDGVEITLCTPHCGLSRSPFAHGRSRLPQSALP